MAFVRYPAILRLLWRYVGPLWHGRGVDRALNPVHVSEQPTDFTTGTGKWACGQKCILLSMCERRAAEQESLSLT